MTNYTKKFDIFSKVTQNLCFVKKMFTFTMIVAQKEQTFLKNSLFTFLQL